MKINSFYRLENGEVVQITDKVTKEGKTVYKDAKGGYWDEEGVYLDSTLTDAVIKEKSIEREVKPLYLDSRQLRDVSDELESIAKCQYRDAKEKATSVEEAFAYTYRAIRNMRTSTEALKLAQEIED